MDSGAVHSFRDDDGWSDAPSGIMGNRPLRSTESCVHSVFPSRKRFMNRLMDIANKSLTIMALAVFPLTAAVNGGYERILEIENQRKN